MGTKSQILIVFIMRSYIDWMSQKYFRQNDLTNFGGGYTGGRNLKKRTDYEEV